MADGVLYMNIGVKHAEHLVVSIYSLRQHWQGPVAIACGDQDANWIAAEMASDPRLQPIQIVPFSHEQQGKGSMYAAKCDMGDFSPFDRTVFLDADTLIVGDFQDMFPPEGTDQVRLTQFAHWTSLSNLMVGRIGKWESYCPSQVHRMQSKEWPAINTGVIGFTKKSWPWFQAWKATTQKNVSFICDEIAAQLIYPEFNCKIMDDRWNCSPVYSWSRHGEGGTGMGGDNKPDPRIWHGHGFKFHKKETGRQLWYPVFFNALWSNIAMLQEWAPNARRKDD